MLPMATIDLVKLELISNRKTYNLKKKCVKNLKSH